MLKQSIDDHELKRISSFPVFYWSSTRCRGIVTCQAELVMIQDFHWKNELNILDAKCTKDGSLEKLANFGNQKEHVGDITLREFLQINKIDVLRLNLYG